MTLENENENAENKILSINYDGLEMITWLNADCQNLINYANQIFRKVFDQSEQSSLELLSAATKSLNEVTKDVEKIKEFLAQYTPENNN